MFLFLQIVCYWFHVDQFGLDILGNLLDLEFSEVGRFNLDLATGNSNDTVLRGLNTLADFLAFTYVNLHFRFLHQ